MADLPQDQQPSQSQAPSVPANKRSPTEQEPTEKTRQPDKSSFPPMQEETSPPAEESVEAKLSSLGIKSPSSKKKRILLAALVVIFILASVPAAVYLVQQRQELRKAAAPGEPGDMGCLSDITIGPDSYSFTAKGVGLKDKTSGQITINLPNGSVPLSDYTYAFWSGEKTGSPANPAGITINGASLSGEKIYHKYNSDWDNTGYIYRVKIPSSLITGTSLTFNVTVAEFNFVHGVGIVVPYEQSTLPTSKITIKSCGDFVYTGPHKERDDKSDSIVFNMSDITSPGEAIRAAFFFGEGEGATSDAPRPNYLYYNGSRLDPTDGTPYPAYSTDGGWWDTRITGEDLPVITAGGTSGSFQAHSPQSDPTGRGESFYFIGGILQYPVTPPEVLQCLNLACAPDPGTLSPDDEIALTCTGSSDLTAPINHFEFRVSIDGGAPVDLGSAEATPAAEKHQGEIIYTIPDYGCYQVECRACVSEDSSNCTGWGQAR